MASPATPAADGADCRDSLQSRDGEQRNEEIRAAFGWEAYAAEGTIAHRDEDNHCRNDISIAEAKTKKSFEEEVREDCALCE